MADSEQQYLEGGSNQLRQQIQQIQQQHRTTSLSQAQAQTYISNIHSTFIPYQLQFDEYMDTQFNMGQDFWQTTTTAA
jgi:hypothetical protein